MSDLEPVVVIENLTKRYGDLVAVDNVSLSLNRGHILGFIGPNGAGKTTTIKILVGLARPTSGTARISGVDCVADARRIKRLVGYMPDTFGRYSNMRVREYLDFFGAAFGIAPSKRRKRIDAVLDITNATYMQDRYVDVLSHGMAQRVGIARTLLHDPEVLVFDEPANGLDPEARIEMRGLLLRLAELGKTLIVTSHILPELSRICDLVAIISNGKLRAYGTLPEIAEQIGQSRMIEIQLASPDQLATASERVMPFLPEGSSVDVSETESLLRFRANLSEDKMNQIIRDLVQASIPVSQFRELQTDLEDAFVSVSQEDKAGD
ncbi:MAG: ABC transporter ATP-binding protein [Planctomycetota bacterium]|nr:ABC transporter ATP-binding protein [Planctomycetota bacterium]